MQEEPGVDQNLAGYFITAFHRRVRQQFLRENRVTYEGLLRELELNHHLTAPDWEAAMEQELCLKVLVDQLPHQSRHMLHYRILGFSWNEIGRALRISGKQARSRFYYELNKATCEIAWHQNKRCRSVRGVRLMGDKHERGLSARRAERRLVKMAGEAARRDFPNPERIDCPNSDAVNAVVVRRLSFPDFDNVVDHIATCAPCFEEYNRRRHRYRLRNAGAIVLACAGLLILGLFWKHGPVKQHGTQGAAAKEAPTPVLTATLDYTNWTAQRSEQSRPGTVETPHLTRAQLDLSIKLPIGTEDGVYTVQFRSKP